MPTVLVTGGTGLVGKQLCKLLKNKGYDVAVLSSVRYNKSEFPIFYWNWKTQEIDENALRYSDYIIHLAGANIAGAKWTPERKQLIVDSRVESAKFLHKKLAELKLGPKAFISSSAVGYYGMVTSKKVFKESDGPSADFLGTTCKLWEEASKQVYDRRIRTVQLRLGIVLASTGGALEKMAMPIKFGVGAPIGTGKQFVPWIHVSDLCALFLHAIENENMNGAYNAVAPTHETNASMTKKIGKALNRPVWLPPVPKFVLKFTMGEMANILLEGSRVSADKVVNTGFEFRFPHLEDALAQLEN